MNVRKEDVMSLISNSQTLRHSITSAKGTAQIFSLRAAVIWERRR